MVVLRNSLCFLYLCFLSGNNFALSIEELNSSTAAQKEIMTASAKETDAILLKKHQRRILDELNNKIENNNQDGDNYFRRAFILYQTKDYKGAMRDCQQASSLGVDCSNLYLLESEILLAQKKYKEALAAIAINKTITEGPATGQVCSLTAEIYNGLKEYAKALQNISKAIVLDRGNAHYYEIRADLDYKVEQYLRSIKDASQAINLNPKSKTAYLIRSKANYAVNDLEQGKLDEAKAKELK